MDTSAATPVRLQEAATSEASPHKFNLHLSRSNSECVRSSVALLREKFSAPSTPTYPSTTFTARSVANQRPKSYTDPKPVRTPLTPTGTVNISLDIDNRRKLFFKSLSPDSNKDSINKTTLELSPSPSITITCPPAVIKEEEPVKTKIMSISSEISNKYSCITSIDELNTKLKETKEFEERRAIRAAIRRLKDNNNNEMSNKTTGSTPRIDLSGYTDEESLKALLHQTTEYDDKKRIRAAIRELRKNSGYYESTPLIKRDLEKDEVVKESTSDDTISIETPQQVADHSLSSSPQKLQESNVSNADIADTQGNVDVDGNSEVNLNEEPVDKSVTSKENIVEDVTPEVKEEIKPSMPKIKRHLVDSSGLDGKSLTLECELEELSTSDDVHVTWLKDEKYVKPSKDIRMTWRPPVACLEILELLYPDDSGRYVCVADYGAGTLESSAIVTVEETPLKPKSNVTFIQNLKDMDATEGDKEFILSCKLSEKVDNIRVKWYKDSKIINNNSSMKIEFDGQLMQLCIKEVLVGDSGVYECVVELDAIEICTDCKLHVREANKPDRTESIADEGIQEKKKKDLEQIKTEEVKANDEVDSKDEKTENTTTNDKDARMSDANAATQLAKVEANEQSEGRETIAPNQTNEEASAVKNRAIGSNSSVNGSIKVSKTLSTADSKTANSIDAPKQQSNPTAQRAWGKLGAMSSLIGKAAPAGARSAMAAFKQMDNANNPNAGSVARPNFACPNRSSSSLKPANGVQRSATTIKQLLLQWCQSKTREYQNVSIDNFSTSWNDGVAFLALIHHFYPDSFDWEKVDPRRRRENFQLAFDLAEKKADISPLLEVDDMVRMKKPDWKCVFTYVQSFYRKLRDHERNHHQYMQQTSQTSQSSDTSN